MQQPTSVSISRCRLQTFASSRTNPSVFLASTILVSSNPTNLILSSSFALPFTTYTAWVILPSIAAAVAAFPVLLFWEYRTDVPKTMEEVDVEPGRALVDPWGAIIGSCLLAVTLAVLVGGSAGGILGGVWEVRSNLRRALINPELTWPALSSRR